MVDLILFQLMNINFLYENKQNHNINFAFAAANGSKSINTNNLI
jgi:hypothetical protein